MNNKNIKLAGAKKKRFQRLYFEFFGGFDGEGDIIYEGEVYTRFEEHGQIFDGVSAVVIYFYVVLLQLFYAGGV